MPRTIEPYRLSPKARNDLEGIWRYIYETWSLRQADTYHAQLVAAFERLAENPQLGRSVDHLRPGYLRHSVGSHFVFYRLGQHQAIEIVRILHQRMDFRRHL